MLKVTVNNKKEHTIVLSDSTTGTIDGKDFSWDVIEVKNGSFHIIKNNKSYNVEVIKADAIEKSFLISVNGNKYQLNVKDKYDELLKSLGLDTLNSKKVNELKSGFYYIAVKANVPIIPVAFDFGRKTVKIGKPFYTTGNYEADLEILLKHFDGVYGKIPEKRSRPKKSTQDPGFRAFKNCGA